MKRTSSDGNPWGKKPRIKQENTQGTKPRKRVSALRPDYRVRTAASQHIEETDVDEESDFIEESDDSARRWDIVGPISIKAKLSPVHLVQKIHRSGGIDYARNLVSFCIAAYPELQTERVRMNTKDLAEEKQARRQQLKSYDPCSYHLKTKPPNTDRAPNPPNPPKLQARSKLKETETKVEQEDEEETWQNLLGMTNEKFSIQLDPLFVKQYQAVRGLTQTDVKKKLTSQNGFKPLMAKFMAYAGHASQCLDKDIAFDREILAPASTGMKWDSFAKNRLTILYGCLSYAGYKGMVNKYGDFLKVRTGEGLKDLKKKIKNILKVAKRKETGLEKLFHKVFPSYKTGNTYKDLRPIKK